MPFESERFWDAAQRAGMLDEAAFEADARGGSPAWQKTAWVDYQRVGALPFEGAVQTAEVSIEYRTADLPGELAVGDRVTVKGRRYRVATHPEPISDGDFSEVQLCRA